MPEQTEVRNVEKCIDYECLICCSVGFGWAMTNDRLPTYGQVTKWRPCCGEQCIFFRLEDVLRIDRIASRDQLLTFIGSVKRHDFYMSRVSESQKYGRLNRSFVLSPIPKASSSPCYLPELFHPSDKIFCRFDAWRKLQSIEAVRPTITSYYVSLV